LSEKKRNILVNTGHICMYFWIVTFSCRIGPTAVKHPNWRYRGVNGPARGGDGGHCHVITLSIGDLAYSGLACSLPALHARRFIHYASIHFK
jgi:hypothetical protein